MFDYGSKEYLIETKKFMCHLPNKNEIVALYRKCHYDVAYYRSYFDKYSKFMCTYVNLNEDIKVLNYKMVGDYRKNHESSNFHDYENMQSVCFTNKKIEKLLKPEKQNEVKQEENSANVTQNTTKLDISSNNISKDDDFVDINSYEIPCDNKVDPLVAFGKKYKEFLVKSKELYKENKFVEILKEKNDGIYIIIIILLLK